jgi:hypothetical protein
MTATDFVLDGRLTPDGQMLLRWMDTHLRRKDRMTEALRHYAASVYRARLYTPNQWLETFPDKAEALWEECLQEMMGENP